MKTRNASNALRGISSESWRNLEKGKVASGSHKSIPEDVRFRVGGYVRISPLMKSV